MHQDAQETTLFDRFRASGLMLPSLAAVAGLAVLIGLGNWQMQRLAWKNDLAQSIKSRAKAQPMTLEQALSIWSSDGGIEYRRVQIRGRFLNDREIHLYALRDAKQGWRIITPVETDTGRVVLVDRGFVLEEQKEPSQRLDGQIEGEVKIVALARAGVAGKSMFEPDNNVSANRWFWKDHDAMVKTAIGGLSERVVPFFLEAEAMEVPGGIPRGGGTRLTLSNKHFEYAMTWYGLAAALIGVFAVFAYGRMKETETAS